MNEVELVSTSRRIGVPRCLKGKIRQLVLLLIDCFGARQRSRTINVVWRPQMLGMALGDEDKGRHSFPRQLTIFKKINVSSDTNRGIRRFAKSIAKKGTLETLEMLNLT